MKGLSESRLVPSSVENIALMKSLLSTSITMDFSIIIPPFTPPPAMTTNQTRRRQVASRRVFPAEPPVSAHSSPEPSSCSSDSSSSFQTAPFSLMSFSAENPPLSLDALKSPYRKAIPITPEIKEHCSIFLDEQIYLSALDLISDLITPGAAHPDCAERPVYAPAPFHIELVSALLIHPKHTNQAPHDQSVELPSRAIALLRNILEILGPFNANLAEAFSFSALPTRTSRRNRNDFEGSSSGSEDERLDNIRGIIAKQGRIRRCATDFWHMVGWAFNCSIKHPKRWRYWKVWLDYMLDVLDADWNEREILDQIKSLEDPNRKDEFALQRQSMLVTYLLETKGRSGPVKRVVRAAFADGGVDSLRDFPEVFPNETKELKVHNGQKRKRDLLGESSLSNLDGNDDSESVFNSSELTESPGPSQGDNEDEEERPAIDPLLGGTESIVLRQRVLALLSRVAAFLPDEFVDCHELYEIWYSCMKPLPLPAFSLLISPSLSSQIPPVALVSFYQLLRLRLLPSSAPTPRKVLKRDTDELNQEVLEKCFLPFTGSTSSINDNAKVSILVESALRLIIQHDPKCVYTKSLGEAIEKGILARENHVKNGGRKKKGSEAKKKGNEEDLVWLRGSAMRLRSLRDWLEEKSHL